MGNRIKVGIVGLGYMGNIHLSKIMQNRDAILTAVYDTDRQKYRDLQNINIICCDDFRKFSQVVDAVIISSPPTTHYKYLRYFLNRGIHCLCEKPPALSKRQFMDLLQISEKENTIFNVVMPERANPVIKIIKERVAMEGVVFFSDRVVPFSNRSTDISVLFDLMIHDIDILTQMIPHKMKRISAAGISLMTENIDILNVRIEYENGGFAILNASRTATEKKRNIRIFYNGGYFSADLIKKEYSNICITKGNLLRKKENLSKSRSDPIEEIDADFIASIRNKKVSPYSAKTIIPVMELCDLVKRRIKKVVVSEALTA